MKKKNGMVGGHDGNVKTHVWFTPPEIVQSLGSFDLDPASCSYRPFDTAQTHYEVETHNGLQLPWFGRVWLNPPYDSNIIDAWMRRMREHNNGIALTFARTDRNTFHNHIFKNVDSIFFVQQRIHFYAPIGYDRNHTDEHEWTEYKSNADKTPVIVCAKCGRAKANSGAPSVLMAYDEENSEALSKVCLKGHHQIWNRIAVIVVGLDKSWRVLVQTTLVRPMNVEEVVKNIELMAPEKVRKNKHYREKIRQQLQRHAVRISKGVYQKAVC